MYVETLNSSDIILFIGIKRHNVTSEWPICFNISVSALMLPISLSEIKGRNIHFTDKYA